MPIEAKVRAKRVRMVIDGLRKTAKRLDKELPIRTLRITKVLESEIGKIKAQLRRGITPRSWSSRAKTLSKATLFVRAHRKSPRRSSNRGSPRILNDTGLLFLADLPFQRISGTKITVGIANRLPKAGPLFEGGFTSPNEVVIAGFRRRNRSGGGTHRVRPYKMRFGSHSLPARPWYPPKKVFTPLILPVIRKFMKDIRKDLK